MGQFFLGFFLIFLFASPTAPECTCWRRPVVADLGAVVSLLGWRSVGDATQLRVAWSKDGSVWGRGTAWNATLEYAAPARWVRFQAQSGTLVRVWVMAAGVTWGLEHASMGPLVPFASPAPLVGDSAALATIWSPVPVVNVRLSVNGTSTFPKLYLDRAEAWQALGLVGGSHHLDAFVTGMEVRGWAPVGWVAVDVGRTGVWDVGLTVVV